MLKRRCLDCPKLIDKGTSRCARCALEAGRVREQGRDSRQERGYDAAHDRERASWQRAIDGGRLVDCWRCGDPIRGTEWHLGHCDIDRSIYHGPECIGCNTRTKGRRGCPHPMHISPDG